MKQSRRLLICWGVSMALTRAQKTRQAAIQNRRRLLIERAYEPKLKREIERMAGQAAEDYAAGGQGRMEAGLEVHRANLKAILGELYFTSIESSRRYLDATLLKREGKASIFDPIPATEDPGNATRLLMQKFTKLAFKESVLITETSKNILLVLVRDSVEEGLGEEQIAKLIEPHINEGTVTAAGHKAPSPISRARTIARTETGMAVSESQFDLISDMELPPMLKEWNATLDGRTRKDHRNAEKQGLKKPEETFRVGTSNMKYPQDRAGSKGQIINCRCVLTWEPEEDLEDDD